MPILRPFSAFCSQVGAAASNPIDVFAQTNLAPSARKGDFRHQATHQANAASMTQ